MRACIASLTLLLALTVGCGGGGSAPTSNAAISGPYEFVVTSNVTGGTTLVEANLTPDGNKSSANGPSQAQILTFENKTWYVNGICAGTDPGQNSVTASVSNNGISLTFDEGGNALSGQGVVTGSAVAANYSITDSKCPDLVGIVGYPAGTDSGGITGNPVPDLGGTFAGSLTLPDGTYNAALGLTEAADHSLAVNANLNGPGGNGNSTLSGSAVGNVMFVSGTVNGKPLTLFGYFDSTGRFTGFPKSMLVFNYDTFANAGVLIEE
jgi:hypothetical protein